MKRIYLLTTEHLEDGLWFREEEDFKVAMNYVAIQAASCPEVVVLAFELLSNHVHFVLKGTWHAVRNFVEQFKHRYAIYYRKKYEVANFLRRNKLDVREIPYEDEAPERAIAYVQMNCVAANICAHPSQYLWGTGGTFFVEGSQTGTRIGDLSGRARERLLHSSCEVIPDDWIVGPGGFILPSSYVNVRAVETLFRTPKRMNFFLVNSSKAKKRIETSEAALPAFKDQSIHAVLPDLCRSLFQMESFRHLHPEEQVELARQIRFRFSADANQIARVCGISYAEAARLLDSL